MFKPEGYQGFVDQPAATLGSSFTIAAALSSFKSTESAVTHLSATIASIDYPKPAILRKRGSEVRIENMHRDLAGNGLMVELFEPVDRGGRSNGAADMTFEMREGVEDAVRQIQGANTIGHPIKSTPLPSQGHSDTEQRAFYVLTVL
ncbi:nucleotide-binding alpha-beta plait [Fusarium coicis]|nr:nucleotide-binding alpha-beta plait [Fusarium coicis]